MDKFRGDVQAYKVPTRRISHRLTNARTLTELDCKQHQSKAVATPSSQFNVMALSRTTLSRVYLLEIEHRSRSTCGDKVGRSSMSLKIERTTTARCEQFGKRVLWSLLRTERNTKRSVVDEKSDRLDPRLRWRYREEVRLCSLL